MEGNSKDTGKTKGARFEKLLAENGDSQDSAAPKFYTFKAKPMGTSRHSLGVIDGDTLDLSIDLGFNLFIDIRVRLAGVDTPELRKQTADGQHFKDLCHHWIASRIYRSPWPLVIETSKSDSFGRWIAKVRDLNNSCLSEYLIAEGAARYQANSVEQCGMSPDVQRYGWKDILE